MFHILFNLTFSIYLILTMFKKDDEVISKQEEKKTNPIIKEKEVQKEEKFTDREKQFLHKKKIRSKADLLVDK